jgi:hypothetical protein
VSQTCVEQSVFTLADWFSSHVSKNTSVGIGSGRFQFDISVGVRLFRLDEPHMCDLSYNPINASSDVRASQLQIC